VDAFEEAKENILLMMDVEFSNEIKDHVKDYTQDWDMYP
jgi:hypothetical protein